MTKTIKMSLAAVALAGFTSAAFAAPTVGGSIAHKFDKKDNANPDLYDTYTKVSLKTSGNVNDNLSYAVSYSESTESTTDLNSNDKGLKLSNAKFTYKNDIGTFVLGRQGLATPWTTASSVIDGTQVGNGVVALIPAGGVTLAVANIVNHNIAVAGAVAKDSDITILAALGKAGGINYEAWYASIAEDEAATVDGATAMTIAASGDVGGVNVKARYSSFDSDALADVNTLMSLEASTNVGSVKVNAGIAVAGEDGGTVSLDGDANAANNIYAGTWNLALGGGVADATLMSVGATMPLTETLTGNVNVSSRAGDGVDDQTEIKAQVSAKVAKNFSLYARAASVTSDSGDEATEFFRTRVFAAYKF
jgi:hypothetical protein